LALTRQIGNRRSAAQALNLQSYTFFFCPQAEKERIRSNYWSAWR
jgi:hypothetical protein